MTLQEILESVKSGSVSVEEAERILTGNKTGSVGLKNVNERLKSTYGKRYGLEIRNTDDGADVSFCIPYQAES